MKYLSNMKWARGALLALAVLMATLLTGSRLSAAPVSTANDFKQCANNDSINGNPLGLGFCHWVGAILAGGNAMYTEGMSVPQRTMIFDIVPNPTTGNQHTFTFSHMATKGSAPLHAYDFLVSYQQAKDDAAAVGINLQLNECLAEIGPPNTLGGRCSALRGGLTSYFIDVDIPDDTFVSVDGSTLNKILAYEALRGNRTLRIWADKPFSGTPTLTFKHMCGNVQCANGGDTQDTDVVYSLTYTSTATAVLVEMAGHLAITCPDLVTTNGCGSNPIAWVNPRGSSFITGGSYHFHYLGFDGDGGNQDNQIQGSAVIGSPKVSTQCFVFGLPCGGQTIQTSNPVSVYDTITLTGTGTTAIAGTATFSLCKVQGLVPDCTAPGTTSQKIVTGTVSVNPSVANGLPIGTAQSPTFTVSGPINGYGQYCFAVDFKTSNPLAYGNTHLFEHQGGSRECFVIAIPTAVTLSSFEASTSSALVDEMTLGFAVAGLLALAAVALVVLRKK